MMVTVPSSIWIPSSLVIMMIMGAHGQTLAQDCATANTIWKKMGQTTTMYGNCCGHRFRITCSWTRVTRIHWSGWSGRSLKNSIPPEIGNLTGLTYLDFSSNQLNGTIPSSIGSLTNLQYLSLGGNRLTGNIPSSIGSLSNLQWLSLGGNRLTGNIPSSIGSLSNLQWLYLFNNQLTGTIPSSIGSLSNLQHISLYWNQLDGTIPPSIGSLSNLTSLHLGGNKLTGTLPSSIGSLSNLTTLYLSYNKLNGTIPSSIGSLSNLQKLSLSSNNLAGTIPSSLGSLSNLISLSLVGNQLTGTIPFSIGSLTKLTTLYLQNNILSGVPSSLSNLRTETMVLLPNPMTLVPYDLAVQNPIGTLSTTNLTGILNVAPSSLRKRQQISSNANLTTADLIAMCPLNNSLNKDIMAGCLAGLSQFCAKKRDLTQCYSYYDTVFSNSVYASVGSVCPAWRNGPASIQCASAIAKFVPYKSDYGVIDRTVAKVIVDSVFRQPVYAPCYPGIQAACFWPAGTAIPAAPAVDTVA